MKGGKKPQPRQASQTQTRRITTYTHSLSLLNTPTNENLINAGQHSASWTSDRGQTNAASAVVLVVFGYVLQPVQRRTDPAQSCHLTQQGNPRRMGPVTRCGCRRFLAVKRAQRSISTARAIFRMAATTVFTPASKGLIHQLTFPVGVRCHPGSRRTPAAQDGN